MTKLDEAVSFRGYIDPDEETAGLKAVTLVGGSLSVYLINPGSSAFPTHSSDKGLAKALSALRICLAAQNAPFDPKNFESGQFSFDTSRPYTDLDVCLPHREFDPMVKTREQSLSLPLRLPLTEITQWTASGRIISAKDLAGATIIIHCPLGYFDDGIKYWNILSLGELFIRINSVPYNITGKELKKAVDKQGLVVYFFQLPAAK